MGGTMGTLVLVVFLILVVVVFSVQNASPVAISFLFWRFDASLAIIVFLSVLIGLITGVIIMSWFRIRRSVREKKESAVKTQQIP
jgi:uncharacterized integral membrane protein